MTQSENCAQIAKELTLAFALKLQYRVIAGQDAENNANLTNAVTTFYESVYRKVDELLTGK